MSRSKRKRAAKAANADFARKKTKLGRKARPDNFTNTAVASRQIHVPNQSRAPDAAAPTAPLPLHTGLSLPDLLARAAHHNLNARAAALNALANALVNPSAAAHAALAARPAAAVSAAATALCDPESVVRAAAVALAAAALAAVPEPAPLLPPLGPAVAAALSHVRLFIRVGAARAISRLLAVKGVSADALFRAASPLPALSDLLTAAKLPQARVDVLTALADITPDDAPDGEAGDAHGRYAAETVSADAPRRDPGRPFYFHARVPDRARLAASAAQDGERKNDASSASKSADPLEAANEDAQRKLFIRVSNTVTEALPPQPPATVLTAAAALLPRLLPGGEPTEAPPSAVTHALTSAARHASSLPPAAALPLARVALLVGAKSSTSTALLRRGAKAPTAATALSGLLPRAPRAAAADLRAAWAEGFAAAAWRGDAVGLQRFAAVLPAAKPLPPDALAALPAALAAAPPTIVPALVAAALAVPDPAALQLCLAAALQRQHAAPAAVARLAARAAARDVLLCGDAAVSAVLQGVVCDRRAEAAAPLADALEWAVGEGVASRETRVRAIALGRAVAAQVQRESETGKSPEERSAKKDGAALRMRGQVRRIAEAAVGASAGVCAV